MLTPLKSLYDLTLTFVYLQGLILLDNLKKQADNIHFVVVQSHPITYGKIWGVFRHLKFHKINKFSDAFKAMRPLISFYKITEPPVI